MIYLLCAICIVLILCIIFNSFSYSDWKKFSKTALRSYKDENPFHHFLSLFLRFFSVLGLIAIIVLYIVKVFSLQQFVACLALVLLAALFGFVPYSSAYWCITEKGIYFARKRLSIKWEDIICIGKKKKGSQTQITVQIRKGTGEMFKTIYYALLIANDKADEAEQIIRDFLNARDRAQYLHKQKLEHNTDLKNRKFY